MPGKAILKESFRKNVIRDMKALQTYKPEYEPVIGIYCELYEQYNKLTKKYIASSLEDISTAKRLEALRKDFLTYSVSLGLTPKGLKDLRPESPKKRSALVLALNDLSRSAGSG